MTAIATMTKTTAWPQNGSEGGLDLPSLLRLRDFGGPLSEYIDALYAKFNAIAAARIELFGNPVATPGGKRLARRLGRRGGVGVFPGGPEARFWHCITSGDGPETERTLDLGRCAVLPRVRPLLELLAAGEEARVRWWAERLRDGRWLFVAPPDFSFTVVLQEGRGVFRLRTFYANTPAAVVWMFQRAVRSWRIDPRPIAQALATWAV